MQIQKTSPIFSGKTNFSPPLSPTKATIMPDTVSFKGGEGSAVENEIKTALSEGILSAEQVENAQRVGRFIAKSISTYGKEWKKESKKALEDLPQQEETSKLKDLINGIAKFNGLNLMRKAFDPKEEMDKTANTLMNTLPKGAAILRMKKEEILLLKVMGQELQRQANNDALLSEPRHPIQYLEP